MPHPAPTTSAEAKYTDTDLEPIRDALAALANGDFRARGRTRGDSVMLGDIGSLLDEVTGQLSSLTTEVAQKAEQVRDIAMVTTAVARGDLTRKVTVDAQGEMLQLKQTFNTMVDQLSGFADEVTRVAREVGTEGRLGGQAHVRGVSGVWEDLTNSVNGMASNLTLQVRNISQVATAVADGDLSQKITVDAQGEVLQLKQTFNTMVGQLSAFADEVTRVAREVGTEGRLGGQAHVRGVSGIWKDLTENVNSMANNLTAQVRNVAQVTTAVAQGDLSKKIDVEARGEILQLKQTFNTMVGQLSAFADEVTRVAREVGTEGRLGGQAEVEGVSGTWMRLTESVNGLASNLTTQVRAIAGVASAVAEGDLTQSIAVDARGEVAELKDNINLMVANLRETTRANREQDWLNTNLARISGLMQGHRDLLEVARLIMSELTPLASAQYGAFYLATPPGSELPGRALTAGGENGDAALPPGANGHRASGHGANGHSSNGLSVNGQNGHSPNGPNGPSGASGATGQGAGHGPDGQVAIPEPEPQIASELEFSRIATYGFQRGGMTRFVLGESLAGQAALERKRILIENVPPGYLTVGSGLGVASPASVVMLPILFEDQVLGVLELASLHHFGDVHLAFFDQFVPTIGVTINTIMANSRTESLLSESQRLATQLQERTDELQHQQTELRNSNAELEDKAALMAKQNRAIEVQNFQIEQARRTLEERAQQLATSSRYKSEFLANMSHELRTPLNSLLVLAKLLAENPDSNLSSKQVEFAMTIHDAGSDLLRLINDILDLSKVEAGKMDVHPAEIPLDGLVEYLDATFRPMAAEKSLTFEVDTAASLPGMIYSDEQRLQQVLRNLLSNAVKFTAQGGVRLRVAPAEDVTFTGPLRDEPDVIAFSVTDTGIGISEEKQHLIFEAFQQADGTTSRRYGGTGLGLSISKDIARLLGGQIKATSRLGHGSTFTLYLPARSMRAGTGPRRILDQGGPNGINGVDDYPVAPESWNGTSRNGTSRSAVSRMAGPSRAAARAGHGAAAASGPAFAAAPDPKDPLYGAKILIVDDDVRNVFALTSVFERCGAEVLYAENGREGIEALERNEDVRLVLMDIMMPELDGYATTEAIRNMPQFADLPIITVTAKAMKGDREKAIASGATDYITKPVDTGHLLAVMRKCLERAAAR